MGPTEAVTTGLSTKYYAFTGRARRSEFWWFQLAVTIATNLTLLIPGTVADLVTALLTLALLVPTTAVAVRRLHDVGRSGWWLLLILVPVLGLIALILWWASPGDNETNAYGTPPTEH
ncbi:DUF805 domain-containing protein [Pimelobacter simplex]|uniref:DUF805 domain-containing protein n=1 Tax=Nocardioides simplex TaxID=2045 RepID=UPI003AAABD50